MSRSTDSTSLFSKCRLGAAAALVIGLVPAAPGVAETPPDRVETRAAGHDLEALSGPKKHQKRQKRPIKMGTSGGNVNDFTIDGPFITCCSGTLGALLRKDEDYFILSNNHVLALTNLGIPGDPINQPGRLDNRCDAPGKDFVGTLSDYKKLKLDKGKNKSDSAIAAVDPGTVDLTGEIVGIGVPGNYNTKPQVGMLVQKSGRTTGVTRGIVDLVNASFIVGYSAECSGDAAIHEARFVKQFRIVSADGKDFSGPGDSGSVILEDDQSCPAQVGLLFAGNNAFTVASKMGKVLKAVKKMKPRGKAELVGCEKSAAATKAFPLAGGLPELDGRDVRLAERIQQRAEAAVLALEGVQGMGIGRSSARPGTPVFKVLVDERRPDAMARVPREIEGVPVEIEMTAPIRALSCPAPSPQSPSLHP